MIRATTFILLSVAFYTEAQESSPTFYDLTVHDAVLDEGGSNVVSGAIHPVGLVPSMQEFRAAENAIVEATAWSTGAVAIAIGAKARAEAAWHDVADVTSNGVWEVAFTMSALRGVGAADDIESQTVGFTVETTPEGRKCHIVQWFTEIPPQMPEFAATHTTNLMQHGFQEIEVASTYPDAFGTPEEYGKTGGVCYRVTASVPFEWGQCFFKLMATGFIIRGNALPIVRGVAGGAHYDIIAQDAVGLTNVILNVRGGFIVDTNNPLVISMMELE